MLMLPCLQTPEGHPVESERASGESRRLGLKRKAGKLLGLALKVLCCSLRTLHSALYAAVFLSTVGNVSVSHKDLKLSKYTQNYLKKGLNYSQKCILPLD